MSLSSFFDGIVGEIRRKRSPVTVFLIGLSLMLFVFDWVFAGTLQRLLAMWPSLVLSGQFYTLVTYPFIGNGLVSLLFMGFWLWWIGGTLETELGSNRFCAFWFLSVLVAAASQILGYSIVHMNSPSYGLWIPIAALTVAWGTRYPSAPITFMFFLPMQGRWLAILAVLLAFFGASSPVAGLFALPVLGFAYLFAANKIPFYRWSILRVASQDSKRTKDREEKKFRDFIDTVYEKQKEREERDRLRKLFEENSKDD